MEAHSKCHRPYAGVSGSSTRLSPFKPTRRHPYARRCALLVDVGVHSNRRVMSPASRVESHDLVVWLQTGVSSGNRPTNILKSRKYCAHRLKARTLGVSGTPVSGAVGKLGDLGDRSSDKIRTLICSDWDPYCMFPFMDGLSCHRVSDLCARF